MITAVDTNILIDAITGGRQFGQVSRNALVQAASRGALVICDIAYTELLWLFESCQECDQCLMEFGVSREHLEPDICFLASRAMMAYRKGGAPRERILADFLIGAHATIRATQLLTRDRGFYRKHFPALTVVDPTHS
jgi:predicted nucleic acid-binding protein